MMNMMGHGAKKKIPRERIEAKPNLRMAEGHACVTGGPANNVRYILKGIACIWNLRPTLPCKHFTGHLLAFFLGTHPPPPGLGLCMGIKLDESSTHLDDSQHCRSDVVSVLIVIYSYY